MSLKVLELRLLWTEEQALIVEADFTKRNGQTGIFRFNCQRSELFEHLRWAIRVFIEEFGLTGVHPNCGITKTGYRLAC